MALDARYRRLVRDGWKLKVLADRWSDELWKRVLGLIAEQTARRHPRTLPVNFDESGQLARYYLKIYYPGSRWGALKDLFRRSKGVRFLDQGAELSEAGFLTPTAVAAGEERHLGFLRRAFVLTLALDGAPLPIFLAGNGRTAAGIGLLEKRKGLQSMGRQIGRLHETGFVHGDLVPSNIFVCRTSRGDLQFYLMDNDRTRRYPGWLPQTLWRRNLVQLNRFPLPAISLQDRLRFFRAYAAARGTRGNDRRLLRWLEARTRRRRRQCDSVDAPVSFRRLMSWQGGFAQKGEHGKE